MSRSARIQMGISAVFTALAALCGWLNTGPLFWTTPDVERTVLAIGAVSFLAALVSVLGLWLTTALDMHRGVRGASIGLFVGVFLLVGAFYGAVNLLVDKMPSPETLALGSMRTIFAAEQAFKAEAIFDAEGDGTGDYGTLEQLGKASPPFLDESLVIGRKHYYVFVVTVTPGSAEGKATFTCVAEPEQNPRLSSFKKRYHVDETGIVRYTVDGTRPGARSAAVEVPGAAGNQ